MENSVTGAPVTATPKPEWPPMNADQRRSKTNWLAVGQFEHSLG
jgi:hypothetical protein